MTDFSKIRYNKLTMEQKLELVEVFKHYYIDENLAVHEIACILGYDSRTPLRKLMKEFNISKSRELQDKCRVSHRNEDAVIEKRKKTMLERYGYEQPFSVPEIHQKCIDTQKKNNEGRGLSDDAILKAVRTRRPDYDPDFEVLRNKDKLSELLSKYKSVYQVARVIGVGPTIIYKYCDKFDISVPHRSSAESWLYNYLTEDLGINDIICNSRKIIPNYEIDLYIPSKKLGIEFNGNYYHSDANDISWDYHQKKSIVARDNGIQIYHIYEYNYYQKWNIIESQLKSLLGLSDERIFARKCEVREVSSSDATEFLDKNHMQGSRGSQYRYGLYYNNELVSIMTFGKNKFIRKNDDIELLRFCSKLNTNVIGGASKLFKYFLRINNPDKVVSYCDLGRGNGKTYELLGFDFDGITPPNYGWINRSSGEYLTRYQCQMKDEEEIMRSNHFSKIYDSGSLKYIYLRNNLGG